MEIIKTSINGLIVIQPKIYDDERGYFMESFKKSFFVNKKINVDFVQENESKSKYGVLRGLHFQKPPYEQSKLVRVVKGKVLDVAVDLRSDSKTFGKYESFILSSKNKKQLFIPKGFAHGFIVLSKSVIFSYKVDKEYNKSSEDGILFNDKSLNINWNIPFKHIKVSEKDYNLKSFKQILLERSLI